MTLLKSQIKTGTLTKDYTRSSALKFIRAGFRCVSGLCPWLPVTTWLLRLHKFIFRLEAQGAQAKPIY